MSTSRDPDNTIETSIGHDNLYRCYRKKTSRKSAAQDGNHKERINRPMRRHNIISDVQRPIFSKVLQAEPIHQ